MKNNKGFSIIELIVSFSISIVVVITLFQIVLVLKEVYEKSSVKTTLLNKQNIIVDLIYEDILDKQLFFVTKNSDYSVTFAFLDSTTKDLKYNPTNNTLSYDDYNTEIVSGSTINSISITEDDNITSINLPITHKLFKDEDFGLHIVDYSPNI